MSQRLIFNHAEFCIADIKAISVENVKRQNWTPGDGVTPLFWITLSNGTSTQISPDSVVDPRNGDLYYRDKDESYSILLSIGQVLSDGYCRWYAHDAVKEFSQLNGYEIKSRS